MLLEYLALFLAFLCIRIIQFCRIYVEDALFSRVSISFGWKHIRTYTLALVTSLEKRPVVGR